MMLATTADLELRTSVEYEELEAEMALRGASKKVQTYTGQTFALATTTERLKVKASRFVKLPQRPVVDVTAVVDMDDVAVEFEWYAGDKVTISPNVPDTWSFYARTTPIEWVDVTYEHGYDDIPDDIIAIVCQIAGRALASPADQTAGGETLGQYSYQTGAAAAAGVTGLLLPERLTLDTYRRTTGSVRVG